jgi:chorismate mutase
MLKAVRGAITARENSREAIREASQRLLDELLQRNRLRPESVLTVVFSVTRDLTSLNPAQVFRELGFTATPLFCVQEADIEGALESVVRVLVLYAGPRRRKAVPVYLDDARELRPDLAEEPEA